MGIPAYFSHIVREHRNILKQLSSSKFLIDYLFLDSNSIIYDIIRSIEFDNHNDNEKFENNCIHEICKQLEYYIKIINPKKKVLIAFDGVAPVAKLKQQQNRRYKNDYLRNLFNDGKKKEWNTSAITPGTKFMKKLSEKVTNYFSEKQNVIVSTSNESGEGEHKIFEYIRKNNKQLFSSNCVIYGLDADLIMLSLLHLKYCKNIYLFRETPHFIKSIDKSLNPNELYALDIPMLGKRVSKVMKTIPETNAICDYVFMSFLLGNDFIPHMPALNIRTNGIDHIFDAYNEVVSNKGSLTIENKINYKFFKKFIDYLKNNEYNYLKHEYQLREKQEERTKKYMHSKTDEEKLDVKPSIERPLEIYINIEETGWQWRYYKTLLDIDIKYHSVKNCCINYLEALEWTLHYYSQGCVNQRWQYHFEYPPLLEDLYKFVPSFETTFLEKNNNVIDAEAQLAFVLPESCSGLLDESMREKMKPFYKEVKEPEFVYAFCKYFWEGHIKLPPLSIELLSN